ncbi:MAG: right-handed parallel beta-helix repeat-containing protein [Bacteroidales bacterium]|nr:right-handed parallel beta-helix repeat-containing protein [Bacteroidales bacterium]
MKQYLTHIIFPIVILFFVSMSCTQIHYSTDPNDGISFSCDTLTFDTLFSTIPSRTKSFLIYNNTNNYLLISEIKLREGENSSFRFNFNGKIPSDNNTLKNAEIMPHDSLYVFVEMTATENNESTPIYIEDELLFSVNGNTTGVILNAYGQNAVIFREHSLSCDTTLTAEHCYLIFDYLHIPEGQTLTITEGVTLYFHNEAHLIVDGNIRCEGTLEQPIVMRGDRFDYIADVAHTPYDYMPGQWGNIYLQNNIGNYVFKYTHIRGGTLGMMLIGASRSKPLLTLENCVIHNMSGYGVYIQEGKANIANCEISNCGISCLLQLGGELTATHCTFANYYPWDIREAPAVLITNYILNGTRLSIFPIQNSTIENSIIFGSKNEELELQRDTFTNALYNVYIADCLIKAKKSDDAYFHNIIWSHSQNDLIPGTSYYYTDTVFINTSINNIEETGYFNFQLDRNAKACNTANYNVSSCYPIDLLGINRLADGKPDMGAYEHTIKPQTNSIYK